MVWLPPLLLLPQPLPPHTLLPNVTLKLMPIQHTSTTDTPDTVDTLVDMPDFMPEPMLDTLMPVLMLDTHLPVLMLLPHLPQPLPISSTPPDLESAPTTSVHEFLANLLA